MDTLVHLFRLRIGQRLSIMHWQFLRIMLDLFFQHLLFQLMQMMNLFIKMFHLFYLIQFCNIKTSIQSSWYWWEFQFFVSLATMTEFEVGALLTHNLFVYFIFEIEYIWYFYWPLIIKLEIIDKLFPYILIVKNILEESHYFMELPHMCSWLTLTIDNPPSCHNSTTFGLYLTLFDKIYTPKCGVFIEWFSGNSFV